LTLEKPKHQPVTTYHEQTVDKILFRVTSIYKGEFELSKALEDLAVQRILKNQSAVLQHSE